MPKEHPHLRRAELVAGIEEMVWQVLRYFAVDFVVASVVAVAFEVVVAFAFAVVVSAVDASAVARAFVVAASAVAVVATETVVAVVLIFQVDHYRISIEHCDSCQIEISLVLDYDVLIERDVHFLRHS